ncbi:winged helix-turn-helix domain-containing protein [Trichocoleus sp. ST-U3]
MKLVSVLERKARQVYYRNQEIELTTKEFNLLEYLMRHPNQVMPVIKF